MHAAERAPKRLNLEHARQVCPTKVRIQLSLYHDYPDANYKSWSGASLIVIVASEKEAVDLFETVKTAATRWYEVQNAKSGLSPAGSGSHGPESVGGVEDQR